MPFHQPDSVRFFTFDSLDELGIHHAIFTRIGGVSPPPWASLNVGGLVGDDPSRVAENRKLAFQAVGLSVENAFDVWQVHSNQVVCTDTPRDRKETIQKGDAILTNMPGVVLFMRFADCVPILLCDPVQRVIGIIHMGWKGSINGIVPLTINSMKNKYHSSQPNIIAAIGPAICVHHYEVGEEVISHIKKVFPLNTDDVIQFIQGKAHFNLWQAAALLLMQAGVKTIEISNICTACELDNWYSHRAEGGITGRFGALIAL